MQLRNILSNKKLRMTGSSLFQSLIIQGTKGFLKHLELQENVFGNEVGCMWYLLFDLNRLKMQVGGPVEVCGGMFKLFLKTRRK